MSVNEEFVTKKSCKEHYQLGRWMFGLLFGMTAVYLALAVYALDASRHAEKEVDQVHRLIERHIAASAEADRALRERLDQIKTDVRETRNMLMKVVHERSTTKVAKDER